jgi:hypothetical protein
MSSKDPAGARGRPRIVRAEPPRTGAPPHLDHPTRGYGTWSTDPMINTDSTAAAPAAATPVLIPLLTFLKRYSISKSSFYRRASEMPPVIKVGRSTLVAVAEADAWARSKLMPAATLCVRPAPAQPR